MGIRIVPSLYCGYLGSWHHPLKLIPKPLTRNGAHLKYGIKLLVTMEEENGVGLLDSAWICVVMKATY